MGKSAAEKLASIAQVLEPKDINYKVDFTIYAYEYYNQPSYSWDVGHNVIDVRLLPDTTQASTVEIDLDDSDYTLLQHPIFAHWAFNIQDVSLSSAKKFKTSRLSNSTNNEYLGDNSDLEWVLGQRPVDFTIGLVTFRLCGVSTQDTVLTLTFEDRGASYLRDKSGFKTVHRGTYTRAGFVALLCREAGVDYWIPEKDVAEPVEMSPNSTATGQKRLVTGKGLAVGEGLTAKGLPLTQSQVTVANVILDVGSMHHANGAALEASIVAGILESTLSTTSTNGTYWGALSGRVDRFRQDDTLGMATCFFQGGKGFTSALTLSQTNTNPEIIAEKAEGVYGTGQYQKEIGYANVVAEAAKIVQSYEGPGNHAAATSGLKTTTPGPYAFTRGPNEDSYDCIQRLAAEVAWYAFVRQNRLWFVSGNYLFQQDPQLTIERGKNGVDTIDLNLDMGARDSIAECTVIARTDLWAALPGMIVQVNKRGPATGKWFVSSFESHPKDLSQQATITLQKPVPKRAEPASATITTHPASDTTPLTLGNTQPGTAAAAYAAAQYLDGLKVPYYKYDRDVTRTLKAGLPVDQGLDCSASVSWVLNAAGFTLPGSPKAAPVSGSFESWGAAGPGQEMTVWCNGDHIFIEFFLKGRPHMQGNTSPHVPPLGGFRLFPWTSNSPGYTDAHGGQFQARHWPNT